MPAGAGGAGERGECARALDEGQHTVRVVLWSIQTSLRTSWPFGRVGELSRKADARRRREVLGHHPRPGGSTHPLATPHVSYPRPRRGRVRRDLPRRAGSQRSLWEVERRSRGDAGEVERRPPPPCGISSERVTARAAAERHWREAGARSASAALSVYTRPPTGDAVGLRRRAQRSSPPSRPPPHS